MLKISFFVKGALTLILPRWAYSRQSGGSSSARYCYSVFMRHLVRLHQTTGFVVPKTVAELGPGDSLGIGLCSLLAGAEKYIGLDVVPFTDLSDNLDVLDELVDLFQSRSPIPDDKEFPRVLPKLDVYAFPSNILDDDTLAETLRPERVDVMREQLRGGDDGDFINYVAPWSACERIKTGSVDWIFSQAVLEHVDNLNETYKAFTAWLSPEAIMSHQIDFKCHNMARTWNGHWATPNWLWRIARGARPYFLNREPLPTHIDFLVQNGFMIESIDRAIRHDGLERRQLLAEYHNLSDEDVVTAGAFLIVRKKQ